MSGNQWSWLVVIDVTTKQGSLYPCDTGIAYAFNQVYYIAYDSITLCTSQFLQQSPTRSQVCPKNPGKISPTNPTFSDVGSINPYEGGSGFFGHGTW